MIGSSIFVASRFRSLRGLLLAGSAITALTATATAQEAPETPARDVVVVVGTQIQGAKPTDALPVTVMTSEDIENTASASGDDLFRSIPQLGDVGFNTSRTIGSVNDARGDTASINLRALGTGNTLVLLNGRRMVNHPGTQSENFTPVVTVNANAIPVTGVSRIEVLLDGASAIYGADAVAGVVNTVLKNNFEGFTAELQLGREDGVSASEVSASFELGVNSFDDKTNISIFGNYFTRDPIFANERDFTANADHRSRLPAGWAGQSQFDNTSTTSSWGGFDRYSTGNIVVNGTAVTNAAGQFHIQPNTLAGCLAQLGNGICIDDTSTRDTALKYNVNGPTTVSNGVERLNLFTFLNHDFTDSLALFLEGGVYLADSLAYREEAPMLGAVPIVIPSTNYYNPFGAVGSPNRLAGYTGPALDISLVGYRPVDAGPRKVEVENLTTRFLAGLRGDVAGWDWESALLYTEANTRDTANRVSNTLFQQALARSTPDAYNPFNGGCLDDVQNGDCTPTLASTIDDITVQVFRDSSTSLASWDAKVSRPDLFTIWGGGEIGVAAGVELRRETFEDDRDPRLDGTINFTDVISGLTTNDVLGNNGTLDTKGSRNSESAFIEFAVPLVSPEMNIPLVQSIDLQLAARYENFDEFGSVTKPKVALSWRPLDFLLFRSSWSEGFRAPNLQQQFETGLLRSNARTDLVFCEADLQAGRITAAQFTTTCPNRSQSVTSSRAGSLALQPEESENLTAGFVFESTFLPQQYGEITLTADWWRVKQTNVIGVFEDTNHILLDYVRRLQGSSNPAVIRAPADAQDIADLAGTDFEGAEFGEILFVDDNYTNLFPREVEGVDIGLYYKIDDTPLGDFNFRINGAYLDTFFQETSGRGDEITAAQEAGIISTIFAVGGEANLVRQDGRPEWRYSSALTWRKGPFGAGWFTSYVGDVEDTGIVGGPNTTNWVIEDYQTHNLYVQYTIGQDTDKPTRFRLGMRNITDETPPIADTNYGYLGDLHSPAGRFVYGSVRKTF